MTDTASLVAALLAFASWPLSVVIGLLMIYVAFPLAFVAVVLGLIGIGTGIYFTDIVGVVTGFLDAGLACYGAGSILWAMTHF